MTVAHVTHRLQNLLRRRAWPAAATGKGEIVRFLYEAVAGDPVGKVVVMDSSGHGETSVGGERSSRVCRITALQV
jgi:hypothetical protein